MVVTVRNGFAEDLSNEGGVFDDIKVEMMSAARENNRLGEENKTLKMQLITLQLEVERFERDVEELDPEYMETRKASREPGAMPTDWNDADDDALIREAQDIYLSGRSLDLDESQKLRELQLYDLQYEKQELQLDLKSAEFLYGKVKDQRKSQLKVLQEDVTANESRIKDVTLRIAVQEKATLSYPQKIDLLKMENKALRKKIKQLKQLLSE